MSAILTLILYSWLLVDTFNGIARSIGFTDNLAVVVRGGIFVYLLVYVAVVSARKGLFLLLLVALFSLLSALHIVFFDAEWITVIQDAAKVLLPILLVTATYLACQKDRISFKSIKSIVLVNSAVLAFNIVLGYMGYGFTVYETNSGASSIGGTGFFVAANEVAVTLLAACGIWLGMACAYRRRIWGGLASAVACVSAFCILTKTALLGTVLIIGRYFLATGKKVAYIVMLSVLSPLVYYIATSFAQVMDVYHRWIYFSETYGYWVYFLGGIKRQNAIRGIMEEWAEHPIQLIVGVGWRGVAENNLFDILQAYGVFGIIIFVIWIRWLMQINTIRKMRVGSASLFSCIALFAFFLLLGVAFIAGHVMQSAMLAVFLALLVAYPTKLLNCNQGGQLK